MKRIRIAASLVCCMLVLALAGCAGGAKAADAESLKGVWQLDPASALGFNVMISLDEDEFAEILVGDAYMEGTWSSDGSSARAEFEDGTVGNLFVSDGKLVLGQDDGSRLVFVKTDLGDLESEMGDDGDDDDGLIDLENIEGDEMELGEDVNVVDEVIDDIKPVKIADDDICKIEVNGKGTDFTSDPGYRLSITNNTDKTIFVVPDGDFEIGGKKYEAGLGEVVDPGETVEAFMYFTADDIGGLEALKNVKGTLFVGDDDTSDKLQTYPFEMD